MMIKAFNLINFGSKQMIFYFCGYGYFRWSWCECLASFRAEFHENFVEVFRLLLKCSASVR